MAENELLDINGRFLSRWRELLQTPGMSSSQIAAEGIELWGESLLRGLNRQRRSTGLQQLLKAAADGPVSLARATAICRPKIVAQIIRQIIAGGGEPLSLDGIAALSTDKLMDRTKDRLMADALQLPAYGDSAKYQELLQAVDRALGQRRTQIELRIKQSLKGQRAGSPSQPVTPVLHAERVRAVLETSLLAAGGRKGSGRVH